MNFTFHIGTHKTGSTALQNFLFSNRKKLLKLGILYPETGKDKAHHALARLLQTNDMNKARNFLSEIEKEARSKGVGQILLSSEEFESVRNPIALKHFFSTIKNARTIIFLRRQDYYLESAYNQHVKMYGTRYKDDIYKFNYHVDFSLRFNYRQLTELWKNYSDVQVMNYDHCLLHGNSIFKVFMDYYSIGLDDNFSFPPQHHSNISIPNAGTIYLARANRLNLSPTQHRAIVQFIAKEFNLSTQHMPTKENLTLWQKFNPVNKCHTEKFNPSPKQRLLSVEDRLVLWQRFKAANDFVCKQYAVEAFLNPVDDAENVLPLVDFYQDFDDKIFSGILKMGSVR